MEEMNQLFQAAQPEVATFTIYQMGRAANALVFIGSILAIWLSFRMALQVRDRADSNLATKIMSSLFGVLVVYGTYIAWTVNQGLITGTYQTLELIKENADRAGMEVGPPTLGFLEYYSNLSEPMAYPGLAGSLFLLLVLVMILGSIWGPKE
tara:strand:- start:751 stop:1206 length:456 start_codon:yes stop_codon:yes gene_type:complete